MSDIIKNKVVQLDTDILQAAKKGDFNIAQSKTTTQKSLNEILEKREQAEAIHKEEKNKHLIEDDLYMAAKKAGDNEAMEAIKNRKLSEEQYQELSTKYWVHSNIVEDDSAKKSEAKEIVSELLEFENDTFKIDSDLWEEVTEESAQKNPNLKKFIEKGIKVKANATWDVLEYMEDFVNGDLKCKKWEQIFIFDYRSELETKRFFGYIAKARWCPIEEVEKRYFLTIEEFKENMKDKPSSSEEYKSFFNEEINGHLSGCWRDGFAQDFKNVGKSSSVWLVGGYRAVFGENSWGWDNNNGGYGFSVRLLKNKTLD